LVTAATFVVGLEILVQLPDRGRLARFRAVGHGVLAAVHPPAQELGLIARDAGAPGRALPDGEASLPAVDAVIEDEGGGAGRRYPGAEAPDRIVPNNLVPFGGGSRAFIRVSVRWGIFCEQVPRVNNMSTCKVASDGKA
jgi:hypothetical protein